MAVSHHVGDRNSQKADTIVNNDYIAAELIRSIRSPETYVRSKRTDDRRQRL